MSKLLKELDKYENLSDAIITEDNVKIFGENIALYTLKHLMAYRYYDIASLYYGLIRDIKQQDNYQRNISEGYDIAQTAICFLCEHIGKKLGDTVIGKYGQVTVKHACSSIIGNYIYRRRKYRQNAYPILECDKAKTVTPFEEDHIKESYNRAEEIVKQMRLTKKQKLTLDCYIKGMGVCEISRFLNVVYSTVWRSRMLLQRKYIDLHLD